MCAPVVTGMRFQPIAEAKELSYYVMLARNIALLLHPTQNHRHQPISLPKSLLNLELQKINCFVESVASTLSLKLNTHVTVLGDPVQLSGLQSYDKSSISSPPQ